MRAKPHRDHDQDAPDGVIGDIAERLRVPLPVPWGFDERVMSEIRAASVGEGRAGATVRARPRPHRSWRATVLVAGVGALAAAALVALVPYWLRVGAGERTHAPPPTGGRSSPVASLSTPGPHTVRFTFTAPNARRVTIAGSFNGWDTRATPMRRTGAETWVADVPLQVGRYTYMFVVDGARWVSDPSALRDAPDDFGTANSVVLVADNGGAT